MSWRSSGVQGAPKPLCSLPPPLLGFRVIFLLIIRHVEHMPEVSNGYGGTITWQRPVRTQGTARIPPVPAVLVPPASPHWARLLDSSGLALPHSGCRRHDESFREEFLPACIFLLLLQVGISKEQGEGAKFITTQVL